MKPGRKTTGIVEAFNLLEFPGTPWSSCFIAKGKFLGTGK